MWKEVAILALGCVMFVNMGLSDAIQETLGFRLRILSCPKCLVWWATMVYLVFSGCRFFTAVGASFLFSYTALWLDLGLSALNRIYNELYQQIISAEAGNAASSKARKPAGTGKGRAGMPEMRKKK